MEGVKGGEAVVVNDVEQVVELDTPEGQSGEGGAEQGVNIVEKVATDVAVTEVQENGAGATEVEGQAEVVEDEDVDAELEEMKRKLKEMEEEAAKAKDIQEASAAEVSGGSRPAQADSDNRSIYVGNVDYGATPEELSAHFQDCGAINRVTILCNKFTGQPKGFAYIEFAEEEAVKNATILNESTFRGRQLKVNPKRTNVPGLTSSERGRGRGRGRGRVFRGSYRAGYRGRYAPY